MRTLAETRNYFGFHPATEETAMKYDEIRGAFLTLVDTLWPLLPDGPDKTVAFRQLHLASMLAIGSVAVNEAPADWQNPRVARVMPHGSVGLAPGPTDGSSSTAPLPSGPAPSSPASGSYEDAAASAADPTPAAAASAAPEPQPVQPDGSPIPTPDTIPDGPPAQ